MKTTAHALTLLVFIPNVVLSQMSSSGTSVVAVRTPTTIFIGADSKSRLADSAGNEHSYYGCKIFPLSNECVFAIAGHSWIDTLDFVNLAKQTFRDYPDFDSLCTNFVNRFTSNLINIIRDIRSKPNSRHFLTNIENAEVFQVVFAYASDKDIRVVKQTFNTKTSGNTTEIYPTIFRCPGDCINETDILFLKGSAVLRTDDNSKHILLASGPVAAINAILNLDSALKPYGILPPFDIIQLSRDGWMWLQKKPECN